MTKKGSPIWNIEYAPYAYGGVNYQKLINDISKQKTKEVDNKKLLLL